MLAQRHPVLSDKFGRMVPRLETHATISSRQGDFGNVGRGVIASGTVLPRLVVFYQKAHSEHTPPPAGRDSWPLGTLYPAATPFPPPSHATASVRWKLLVEQSLPCRTELFPNKPPSWSSGIVSGLAEYIVDTCPFACKRKSASEYLFGLWWQMDCLFWKCGVLD